MSDIPKNIQELTLYAVRRDPVVWVSRVAIFEDYNPRKLLRDVPLHRGLNIIWGKEEHGKDGKVRAPGHGVGKTTFCRLIRYCLGEKHFARPRTRERIRWTFPDGYVGAEVHVNGERWAVARPFGTSRLSFAAKGATIEQLLDTRPQGTYEAFRNRVSDAVLNDLELGAMTVGLKEPILWDHVLAWCSRDQECRFQNLWEWRSARSGSETPQFKKPKVGAVWMLRAVLKLLRDEEIKAEERLFELAEQVQTLEKNIEERRREPEYWRRHYRQHFVTAHGISQAIDAPIADDAVLFGLPALVRIRSALMAEQTEAHLERLQQIDRDVAALTAQLGEIEQFQDLDDATATTKSASSDALVQVSDKTRNLIEEIRKILPFQRCRYGSVMLRDCSYVQEVLGRGSRPPRVSAADMQAIAQNDQTAAAAKERHEHWQQMVKKIRSNRDDLLKQRQEISERRTLLLQQAADLGDSLGKLQTWESYFTKDVPDPQLVTLQSDLGNAEREQADLRAKLTTLLQAQTEQRTSLTRLYNGVVKSTLSVDYAGHLSLSDDDMAFSFSMGNDSGGEAMDTLALLMADVSAMLLAVEGRSLHPGILIHDSPREADLGSYIYQNLLEFLAALHEATGGNTSAPFQYIVTTTTPPPQAMRGMYVSLPLSGADPSSLLFTKPLATSEPPPPTDPPFWPDNADEQTP